MATQQRKQSPKAASLFPPLAIPIHSGSLGADQLFDAWLALQPPRFSHNPQRVTTRKVEKIQFCLIAYKFSLTDEQAVRKVRSSSRIVLLNERL